MYSWSSSISFFHDGVNKNGGVYNYAKYDKTNPNTTKYRTHLNCTYYGWKDDSIDACQKLKKAQSDQRSTISRDNYITISQEDERKDTSNFSLPNSSVNKYCTCLTRTSLSWTIFLAVPQDKLSLLVSPFAFLPMERNPYGLSIVEQLIIFLVALCYNQLRDLSKIRQ